MKHVVLDRDGTLIRHVPYLRSPADVEVLPTVVAGLIVLLNADCRLFLHSNQSGVGRGYFSLADAVSCNDEMMRQIGLGSAIFTDICIAPETPNCEIQFRKPSPNFGRKIIEKFAISESDLYYLGDNASDLLTARNIGCSGVGVNTGLHDLPQMLRERNLEGDFVVFDRFIDAANHVVG